MAFNTIPVNGWPQLKELDELARKVGNIPTFTSSDKEAIADLISNAQALIAVAEDGAAGVPFDNTGTDFESTNVQAAIEEAATMGGGGLNLSTTAAVIGKWGNDDLYGVLISAGALPNATTKRVNAGMSGNTIRYFSGIGNNTTTGGALRLPHVSIDSVSGSVALGYDPTEDQFVLQAGTDRSAYNESYIIVLYTVNPTP